MKADTTATITIDGVKYNATVTWDAAGTTAELIIKDAEVALGTDGADIKAKVTTISLVDAAGNAVDL